MDRPRREKQQSNLLHRSPRGQRYTQRDLGRSLMLFWHVMVQGRLDNSKVFMDPLTCLTDTSGLASGQPMFILTFEW